MEPKKMTGAWLGAFVAMFLLSYVWHDVLMGSYLAKVYVSGATTPEGSASEE